MTGIRPSGGTRGRRQSPVWRQERRTKGGASLWNPKDLFTMVYLHILVYCSNLVLKVQAAILNNVLTCRPNTVVYVRLIWFCSGEKKTQKISQKKQNTKKPGQQFRTSLPPPPQTEYPTTRPNPQPRQLTSPPVTDDGKVMQGNDG